MKNKPVISQRNMPRKFPIHFTIEAMLVLKVFQLNAYIVGATYVVLILLWFLAVSDLFIHNEQEVDLFQKHDRNNNVQRKEVSPVAE